MQNFLCPQCGAAVAFKAPGAVMVVCAACRSTLTRDAEAARRVGELSEVVDDGSAVRIGTRGSVGGQEFEVLGRLRMQYDEGGWNEWYVLFDVGGEGWLSDASGQYALTRRREVSSPLPLPAFDALKVGDKLKLDGDLYTLSDVRRSRCIGGEGELPVHAGDGWAAAAADGRSGKRFATLDYSDGAPVAYVGYAGDALKLRKETLRSREEIIASIGRYRGQILALDCPSCGMPVSVVAAMATQVICAACSSLLDFSGERAEIVEAGKRSARFKSTLALGASGQLGGSRYTVIGILRCGVPNDAEEPEWTEYLLFDALKGYQWLVETEDGWQRVSVCDEWPVFADGTDFSCRFAGGSWVRGYEYRTQVKAVFGAFNWRVRRGDRTRVSEYVKGGQVLTREQSDSEITWSLAVPVPAATVAQAFGLPVPARKLPKLTSGRTDEGDQIGFMQIAWIGTVVLLILGEDISRGALLMGLLLIWAPAVVLWCRDNLAGQSA